MEDLHRETRESINSKPVFDVPGSTNFTGFKEISSVPKTTSRFSFGFPVVINIEKLQ